MSMTTIDGLWSFYVRRDNSPLSMWSISASTVESKKTWVYAERTAKGPLYLLLSQQSSRHGMG